MATKEIKPLTTGRLIEAVMKYRGMDVEELAKAIDYHPMNLYKLLNGSKNITDRMALKIGKALNMSPLVIMQSHSIEFLASIR
jgi:plasmid maintenance system antidote protein VapI